jgi:hypothetical protein
VGSEEARQQEERGYLGDGGGGGSEVFEALLVEAVSCLPVLVGPVPMRFGPGLPRPTALEVCAVLRAGTSWGDEPDHSWHC